MLGAAAIGLSFPFWGGVPGSEQNIIPRFASQWYVGKGTEEQPTLQYLVHYQDKEFLAKMHFLEKTGDNEKINLVVDDKKTGQHLEQELEIGQAFVFIGVNDDLKPYVQALDKSVFSVRDTLTGPKYLVVGAEWGTTFVGKFNPKLKATEYTDTKFEFGKLKTFTISYKINEIENKLWVADNIPLPVKALYYNLDGTVDYSYELVSLEGNCKIFPQNCKS
ncbi:MAG: hypothetical protein EB163_06625 [Nitrososphaeria archaeon]|nr:hypothetical protein [Nitrososphaeria archaeon]NDB62431.1 hypothetical protein [Nitrosopumilaceae archaeon]NDB90398.1 hypothetical protein [Nitrososphaerota archaeon]NDB46948.1 hypothetical protein [Nitrososphaeria archaeon]NDF24550.1 hypothetical protein [Nitrososphaerota archaeon]